HHAGAGACRDRSCGAGGAVDDGHLAEKLAFAEGHDDGLAAAADPRNLDVAVEHHKQLATARALLENNVTDAVFVDTFFDGHGVSRLFGTCLFPTAHSAASRSC